MTQGLWVGILLTGQAPVWSVTRAVPPGADDAHPGAAAGTSRPGPETKVPVIKAPDRGGEGGEAGKPLTEIKVKTSGFAGDRKPAELKTRVRCSPEEPDESHAPRNCNLPKTEGKEDLGSSLGVEMEHRSNWDNSSETTVPPGMTE